MLRNPTLFDEPHPRALELLAARALSAGDDARAFAFSDRRCRIAPAPQAHSYLLRAEAAFRLGLVEWALEDCRRALDIAPENIAACRRMLAWSAGAEQHKAARALLANDDDVDVLRKALAIVWSMGETSFATVVVLDDVIRGWAAWRSDATLEIAVHGDTGDRTVTVVPADPFNRLSDAETRVAAFDIPREPSSGPQSVVLALDGETIHAVRGAATKAVKRSRTAPAVPAAPAPGVRVFAGELRPTAVIVPVYQDFEATRLCLHHLLPELGGPVRAIVVNDASPDRRIHRHLQSLAGTPSLELLINQHNLGFVGAVNRALARVDDEDVVLLNADTIVPPGFLDRLAAAAYAAPDIGTVMPLSNNGEFASFPTPNEVNPLPRTDEIIRLDELAADVNLGAVVDVPSGIGFCLYITAACASAVGPLHDRFHRGYLEDVDFCLRARALGFRNVCAASVYVGHAGSRSFREEKRSLVLRNLDILDTRFPSYRTECLAYVEADPLRAARAAIELAALEANHPVLIVRGGGAIGAVAHARGRRISHGDTPVLLLTVGTARGETTVTMSDPVGGAPQSLRFGIDTADDRAALEAVLRHVSPARIEIVDPRAVTPELLELFRALAAPLHLVIADAGLACPPGIAFRPEFTPWVREGSQVGTDTIGSARWVQTWREVAERADRVIAPCEEALQFARRITPGRQAELEPWTDPPRPATAAFRPDATTVQRLGVVAVRGNAAELRMIRAIAAELRRDRPATELVVLGWTLDDACLLRSGNVFVSGRVDPDELDALVVAYGLSHLLTGLGEPLFGHPLVEGTLAAARPVARLDWSFGTTESRDGDLLIDPRLGEPQMVALLRAWMVR
ncbi:glycosyltransferase [Rhodoplanes roseus]|uniref:Glycosyltransferase 2-like domain-containing protein n=1 Tax=Rhodoplanes roseus TaxID=29409 RepID=A0A327L4B1_9BRAD|nr:glycosyltransferase [Rhodoplanes roseus]RAI45004.1 hypothetical protein CH341_06215 [Rhodoplanes roseus]